MTLFIPIQLYPDAKEVLWELLGERKPHQNISHSEMPTWEEHCAFVDSEPYDGWWLIEDGGKIRGSVYFTKQREIGIFVFERYAGMGYGADAVKFIEDHYELPVHANISIRNAQSMAFFVKQGYEFLQVTLRKSRDNRRGWDRPSRLC
jgi:RimJ/RimL family protein N-acetyltransferase